MSCSTCVNNLDGKPSGCKSNGTCGTKSCNKLNTYDWMVDIDRPENDDFDLVEVSFKNGARKAFFHNPKQLQAITGDMVVLESGNGYDIGQISLSGELVRLQMKKRKVREGSLFANIIRIANQRDLEKLREARILEKPTMVRARVISRTLGLDMKIGDIEYQGDKRKATFFYTADGRVDFRELIRHFAKEFKVKIEMRQIGARQESARIGGLGSCGRELCCSTWLTDFKSVTTSAARYQNLAINQAKLSGMCGRLKCCLNYELDTYMDALEEFPDDADKLYTVVGTAYMVKTDIFKRTMYYQYARTSANAGKPSKFYALDLERVDVIMAMNAKGEKPEDLIDPEIAKLEAEKLDFDEELTGVIELKEEKRHYKKKKRRKKKVNPFSDGDKQRPSSNNNRSKNKRSGGRSTNKDNKPKSQANQKGDARPKDQRPKKDNKPARNQSNQQKKGAKDPVDEWDKRPDNKPKPKRDNRPPRNQTAKKGNNKSENDSKDVKGDKPSNKRRPNRRNNKKNNNRNNNDKKDTGDKKE